MLRNVIYGVDSLVSQNKDASVCIHKAYYKVLAYNPVWGEFAMTPDNTANEYDVKFGDCKRGDVLLCSRVEHDGGNKEYFVKEFKTIEALKQEFVSKQFQK